jgi:hypothetical protein
MEILRMRKENKALIDKDKTQILPKFTSEFDELTYEFDLITNANRDIQDQIKKKKALNNPI